MPLKLPDAPRGCHILSLVVATFFLGFALLLVHAPFWAEVMWKPPYVNPQPGVVNFSPGLPNFGPPWPGYTSPYGPVPGQETGYDPVAPTCTSGNLFFTLSYPSVYNQTCTPGLSGDLTCRAWSGICDSYCAAYESQVGINGFCVNGTQSPCWSANTMFPLTHTCVIDPYYVPPLANRYPTGRSSQTELQTANAVMMYYINNELNPSGNSQRVAYVRGIDYWRIMLIVSPFYFLMVLPYTTAIWSGALHMLLSLVAVAFAFINTVQAWLWLWILTSLAGNMIRPATSNAPLTASQWVYTGASLVVSGQWFMVIAQTIFFILVVRYFRSQNNSGEYSVIP